MPQIVRMHEVWQNAYFSVKGCRNIWHDYDAKFLNDFVRLTLIHTVGKNCRIVPILVTEDALKGLEKLSEVRSLYMHRENPYVFGVPGTISSRRRTADALREICRCLTSLNSPESITTTRFRKHLATYTQVLHCECNSTKYSV